MFLLLDPTITDAAELVQKPDFSILQQIASLAGHFGKSYCYPSQEEICKRVEAHHGRRISRRTINRHLATLELSGYIQRVRRHCAQPRKGMVFRSTLYMLTKKTHRLLAALFDACRRAVSWGRSRVPKPAQYIPPSGADHRRGPANRSGPPPKSDRSPPMGAAWANKKAAAAPHIANLRRSLA